MGKVESVLQNMYFNQVEVAKVPTRGAKFCHKSLVSDQYFRLSRGFPGLKLRLPGP